MAKDKKLPDKALEVGMKNLKGFVTCAANMGDPVYISTGDLYLDLAIAHGVSPDDPDFDITKYDLENLGGLPLGYLSEFSGAEGSGKSYRSYRVVANGQKKGKKCLWIDAEHSFSKSLAGINDVDLKKLDVADLLDKENPDHIYSAEEIFDKICAACAHYDIIVLDSVANLCTQAEIDNGLSDGGVGMGALAGVLSKACKKVANHAALHGTLVIIINQIREKIGVLYGNPEYTPGGRALRHSLSVRLKINKLTGKDNQITQEGEDGVTRVIGAYSNVWVQKNRFGKPVNEAIRTPVFYTKYFPNTEDLIFDAGRATGIVRKYKSEFRWGEVVGEGKKDFIAKVQARNEIEKLLGEIKVSAVEQRVILQPEVVNYKSTKVVVEEKTDEAKVSRRRKTKDTDSEPSESVEA